MKTLLKRPYISSPLVKFKPDTSIVLWLPGQQDSYASVIRDYSGNNNHGTLVGATWVKLPSGLWVNSFDGTNDYIDMGDKAEFSPVTTGALTAMAWIRPDTLEFPVGSGSDNYVNFFGKSQTAGGNAEEWEFRMQSFTAQYPNRISIYVLNSGGKLGVGSYFQDAVVSGQWIHVAGTITMYITQIYKNGIFRYHYHHQTSGTKATATCTISGGVVDTLTLVEHGTEFDNTPYVNLYGGGSDGAKATATVINRVVDHLTLTAGGSGYISSPTVVIGIDPSNTTSTLRLGHCEDESDPGYFLGCIGLCKIFNRVLTAAEILDIYNKERSLFGG